MGIRSSFAAASSALLDLHRPAGIGPAGGGRGVEYFLVGCGVWPAGVHSNGLLPRCMDRVQLGGLQGSCCLRQAVYRFSHHDVVNFRPKSPNSRDMKNNSFVGVSALERTTYLTVGIMIDFMSIIPLIGQLDRIDDRIEGCGSLPQSDRQTGSRLLDLIFHMIREVIVDPVSNLH